jgi:hypothetical protein
MKAYPRERFFFPSHPHAGDGWCYAMPRVTTIRFITILSSPLPPATAGSGREWHPYHGPMRLTASHFSKKGAMVGLEFWVRFRRPVC